MGTRIVNEQSALLIGVIFVSIVLFILALGGCASTPPVTGPGSPDETQLQHYERLKSAIEAKSKIDALAALALFEADIFRWHTNALTHSVAITELLALTNAVDKEEWASANKMLIDLKSKYRPE